MARCKVSSHFARLTNIRKDVGVGFHKFVESTQNFLKETKDVFKASFIHVKTPKRKLM